MDFYLRVTFLLPLSVASWQRPFWNGMASPPEATALNRILPADKRASMLSAVSLSVQLGGLAGALGFGFIVGRFGITIAWLIAAGVLAASASLFLMVRSVNLVHPGSGQLPKQVQNTRLYDE